MHKRDEQTVRSQTRKFFVACWSLAFLTILCLYILPLKRPSEDALFAAGWKDDAGFFGGADAYMTLPFTRRERNLLVRSSESHTREFSVPSLEEESELFQQSEEDSFLPNPSPLLSLPLWLQSTSASLHGTNKLLPTYEPIVFGTNKDPSAVLELLDEYLFSSYPQKVQLFFSRIHRTLDPLLPRSGTIDHRLWLDYLPLIRCMAVLDREAACRAAAGDPAASNNRKRQTRRSTQRGFEYHLGTKVPPCLWGRIEAKDMVASLAESALRFF
jgi:hypothetical protein